MYNDEKLVLVEENLNYYSNTEQNTQTINKRQFNFIDSAKISDIVHLVSKTNLRNEYKTKFKINFFYRNCSMIQIPSLR